MLAHATGGRKTVPRVFFCASSRCWESYNAALRAQRLGYTKVLWYRGGLAAWEASGGPMTGGQGGMPSPGVGAPRGYTGSGVPGGFPDQGHAGPQSGPAGFPPDGMPPEGTAPEGYLHPGYGPPGGGQGSPPQGYPGQFPG